MSARPVSAPRHLAIRAPNWVGDLVMATPILETAVADARFERVSVVVRAHLAPILRGAAVEACLRPLERGASEVALYRQLAPDAVLLLSSSFGAAWRARRAGVRRRIGAALAGRSGLLTQRLMPPMVAGRRFPIPTARLLAEVAALVGIRPADMHPRLHVGPETRRAVRARLERRGLPPGAPYVLCTPSAAFGAAKMWPARHHGRTLFELGRRRGLWAVVTGGPGEEPVLRAVAAEARALGCRDLIDLSDEERDLETLKALVADAALLLSSDSGPRWFAAAFDVPCVTVMGPNFPELTASSLERCEVVRLEDLECAPCLQRRCPLGHHRCLDALEPERALAAADRLLAGPGAAAAPAPPRSAQR